MTLLQQLIDFCCESVAISHLILYLHGYPDEFLPYLVSRLSEVKVERLEINRHLCTVLGFWDAVSKNRHIIDLHTHAQVADDESV